MPMPSVAMATAWLCRSSKCGRTLRVFLMACMVLGKDQRRCCIALSCHLLIAKIMHALVHIVLAFYPELPSALS